MNTTIKFFLQSIMCLACITTSRLTFAEDIIALEQAVKDGKVDAEIKGIGGSTGDAILIIVRRKVPEVLRLSVTSGTVFKSVSGRVQNMVGASIKGESLGENSYRPAKDIVLTDNDKHSYVVEAYCLDFHKDNPGPSDLFSIGSPDERAKKILQEGKVKSVSIAAIQSALWMGREGVLPNDLKRRFPVTDKDIEVARGLLQTNGTSSSKAPEKNSLQEKSKNMLQPQKVPTRSDSIPPSTSQTLSNNIQRWVVALGYSDKVGLDFAEMVSNWDLLVLKQQVDQVHKQYEQKEMSASEVAEIEAIVVNKLCQKIAKEIPNGIGEYNLLGEIVEHKKADSTGYAQLVYILANCIGLPTVPFYTNAFINDDRTPFPCPTCLARLTDGRVILADVLMQSLSQQPTIPFALREAYRQDGDYYELKKQTDTVPMLGKIRQLNRKGLMSIAYVSVGIENVSNLEHGNANAAFSKALEINPGNAAAHLYRGLFYLNYYFAKNDDLQDPTVKQVIEHQVLQDLSKAVELDPKHEYAYLIRGNLYHSIKRLPEAMSDYSKTIELSPKDAYVYVYRGNVNSELQHYKEAITDYKKAVELNPEIVNATDHKGWTPLHYAAMNGNKEIAELLIANGANVYIADNMGVLPSDVALHNNKMEVAGIALKVMRIISEKLQGAYVWHGGSIDVLKLHVARSGLINATALQSSSGLMLLSKSKNINEKKTMNPAEKMAYGTVKRLIREGDNVIEDGIVIEETQEHVNVKIKINTTSGEGEPQDHWISAEYSQGVDLAYVTKPVNLFTSGYFLIPGIRNVQIAIDRNVKTTHYAGLAFVKPCTIDILPNGTLLCHQEGIVCKDKDEKSWISRKVHVNNRDLYAFFPVQEPSANSGQNSEATQFPKSHPSESVGTQEYPATEINKKPNIDKYVNDNLVRAGKAKARAMGKNPICLASEERGVFITDSTGTIVNNQIVFVDNDMLINVGKSIIPVSQVPGLSLAPGEWAIKVDGKFVKQSDRVDSGK